MKTKLKHIVSIQTGLFARPSGSGQIAYLQAKHFDENGLLIAKLHPDIIADGISEKHILQQGDVLFAAKGIKNFAAVYENKNPIAVASTSFFVIRLTSNSVLPEYLAWFLNQPRTQIILKENAIGTAMPSIRKDVLEELEIVVPNSEKQATIIKLSLLLIKESNLRMAILQQRKQLIEQQIIQAINYER